MKRTAVRHCLLWTCAGLLAACGGGGDDRATAMSSALAVATAQEGNPSRSRALATTSVVEATSSTLTTQAVNLQDAIAILKMIVGLEVNSSGESVTSYQAYAADLDGNGKVELADAISVLKRVVGLETPTASWMFFNQSAGAPVLSDKLNPGVPANLTADVVGTTTSNVGLAAVLRGDVVGSSLTYAWALTSKPSSSSAVLTGATASSPTFTADLVGSYVATMTVSDGTNSASTAVTLTAAIPVPGTPTIGAATAGDTTASIAFTAGSTGGQTVTYTASCSATGATTITTSGSASPLALTGLTNAKTYACTVTPASSAGTGTASGAVSVTPIAAVPSAPTIGTATAGSASASISFTAAAAGSTATSFSVTCTPTSGTAVTVSGTSSPISVTSLTNGTSYSCAVKSVGSGGSSSASSALSVTPVASTAVSYSTPSNFADLVAKSYTPATTLTASSTVTSRGYYMISDAATASTTSNYASIGSTYSATTGYTVTPGTLAATSTYNDYLTKTMQLVAVVEGNNTYYRFDSYLHPNNSIDVASASSTVLQFKNNFGKTSVADTGYLTFSYDSSTGLIKAQNRYVYATTSSTSNGSTVYTGTHTLSSFTATGKYITYTNGAYSLSTTGTRFYLYTSPLSLGIPTFMNPNSIAFVTNGAAPFLTKVTPSDIEGTSGSIYKQVKSTYQSQVATVGTNTATKTAATEMLASITTSMAACKESLRYSTEVYSAYRDAALATKLVSDSIADGAPGQNLVPYVYFTNEQDTSGKCHPFMVVVSYGNQASPNGLKDVPHPPGSGGTSYPDATVTRYSNLENYTFTIPMKDYGLVTDVTKNVYPSDGTRNLWYDTTSPWVTANVYTWADAADNGILIDGSVMFPAFNNALVPSHLAGELSASGCHVGQGGGGPHCHADGYQSGQGLGLYNDADYVGKTHPPLLGFGYDGIALFGQYRSSDSAMLGYGTALDEFGVHNHDAIGYHYHAHTVSSYTSVDQKGASTTKDMHVLMKGAYIGSTNSVPFFRTNSSFNTNKYMGGTVK